MPHFDPGGTRLHYRFLGEGNPGPLLVLLPGNTASGASCVAEAGHFAKRFRVVVPDFEGTGGSGRLPVFPLSWWERAALDAAALARHLGEERCVAVGSSGGGAVALLMAAREPELVRAVVADSVLVRFDAGLLRREVRARRRAGPELREFWRLNHGEDWEQVVQADSALLLELAREAEQGRSPLAGLCAEIRCPVLLTASLEDASLSEPGRQIPEMLSALDDGRALLVSRGGHPLMWTRPETFRGAADAFLAEVCGA